MSPTLGDHTEDYDIVENLVQEHGLIENIDAVPSGDYWETVRKHDRAS